MMILSLLKPSPARPPEADAAFPIPGTRQALAEWERHHRALVHGAFLEGVAMLWIPWRERRQVDLPSTVLFEEMMGNLQAGMRGPEASEETLRPIMETGERLQAELHAYEAASQGIQHMRRFYAFVGGVAVPVGFMSAAAMLGAFHYGAASFGMLAAWAGVTVWAVRRHRARVAPEIYP